ncbi:uncharacterized protein LOC133314332 [Gastrolobium bilobum]|uniref:uncharacterized protein LOC133314332 n=1 Tax=Gastrolobium bilobum TaxID=150636 RepID=UPI002AB0204D|nr:uncharacterized protein LOC133314332 [Gastrolobium bilobum]
MARGNNNRPPPAGSSACSSLVHPSPNMEDISSPYHLSNADHPGIILIPHSLLGPNYNSWRRSMFLALTAKNKVSFVNGSLLQPTVDDLLFSSWNRCNSMVTSWILNSVSKDIANSLMYFSTAYDLWADLRARFHQANGPRIFQLKQQISSLHQGALDVNGYYMKLKIL